MCEVAVAAKVGFEFSSRKSGYAPCMWDVLASASSRDCIKSFNKQFTRNHEYGLERRELIYVKEYRYDIACGLPATKSPSKT
jgi:hypothetical protein